MNLGAGEVVPGALDDLPIAAPGPGRIQDISRWNERLMHKLPGKGEQRKLKIWLVLASGLRAVCERWARWRGGAVAFTLLRQLPVKPANPTGMN